MFLRSDMGALAIGPAFAKPPAAFGGGAKCRGSEGGGQHPFASRDFEPGVGWLVSHSHADSRLICMTGSRERPGLIVHLPELGMLTRSRAASLAGLAPVTRESGNWKGRSFI
ncbi:hypothetical protein [Candidatus Palauibacter sp.]|uniref:hypothetical protein n=1 Tax=Candidatus Palauibacter sp. TaxID=3101350 RepID=UPI003B5C91DB